LGEASGKAAGVVSLGLQFACSNANVLNVDILRCAGGASISVWCRHVLQNPNRKPKRGTSPMALFLVRWFAASSRFVFCWS